MEMLALFSASFLPLAAGNWQRLLEPFQYGFMVRAFWAGLFLAIALAMIGSVVVYSRLSMIGDALAHASLAGVAIGLVAGMQPLVGAMISCIVAAFLVEALRRLFPRYAEVALVVVLSLGIGIAGLLSGAAKAGRFESYLFGSIIAISPAEMHLTITVAVLVLLGSSLLYRELFFLSYDEEQAKLAGVPTVFVHSFFTLLEAISIAIAARLAGSLVVSSLLVLPVVTSMLLAKSYRQNLYLSCAFALLYMESGILISFYWNTKPGATVVIIAIVGLLLAALYRWLKRCLERQQKRRARL